MTKENLLIQLYGDSLSMPRVKPLTRYYETYQELLLDRLRTVLSDRKVYLYTRSHPGTPISSLYSEYKQDLSYFGNENQEILLIHCGIVDCAPRPIPSVLRALISHAPVKIREKIIKVIHDRRAWLLSRGFTWRVTKIDQFKRIYWEWLSLAIKNSSFVVVVNIAPTIPDMEKHSPGLSSSIKLYNQIIYDTVQKINFPTLFLFDAYNEILSHPEKLVNFIDPNDGHHLTREGHQLYADSLSKIIQNMRPNS